MGLSGRTVVIGLALLVPVFSGSATGAAPTLKKKPTISAAAKECRLKENVSDRGKTLAIDTVGEDEFSGDSYQDVICALDALKAPNYINAQIEVTRALDGMVRGRWKNFRATWTYHPDAGLNIIIREKG